MIDKFQWFGLKHETKKLLIRFRFEDDGFSIESIIQEDFIRWEASETFVSKDETIVDVADVTDE